MPTDAMDCLNKVDAEMKASPQLQLAIIGKKAEGETEELAKQRVVKAAVALTDIPDERLVFYLGTDSAIPIVQTFYVVRKSSADSQK